VKPHNNKQAKRICSEIEKDASFLCLTPFPLFALNEVVEEFLLTRGV
jgi:hypothetical protein